MRLGLVASMLLVGIALAAQQAYVPDVSWKAPEKDAKRRNPLMPSESIISGGQKLFLRNCKQCHGEHGNAGLHNSANLQLAVVQEQSDGTLFWKITNGNVKHGMPSFSGLAELQRWQLVLHIRSLAASAPK